MTQAVLKKQERVSLALRELFRKYGYAPYKMNKFEAYDLYVANKDFLVSDGIITFNDTDGKLLALKPDVTLSIIKNATDGETSKVFYNENVYRISGETKQYKEIMQVGLERIGDTDVYALYETVYLAAQSLQAISENFVLDVSHLGILSALFEEIGAGERFNGKIMRLLAQKNAHGISEICKEYAILEKQKDKLFTIVRTYGDIQTVLKTLAPLCESKAMQEAYNELSAVCGLLLKTELAEKIRLDFSVVHNMNYYNGFVFKGFVEGIGEGVLSGGQYDRLMARMNRKAGGIGFAVYLDLLEGFGECKSGFDVDALVLYDDATDLKTLAQTVNSFIADGKSVNALKSQGKIRCKELVDLTGGGK
ncbi:MAG: ATP phosphoribosyltransferase regulatory subunit [Clostridia bacterium]|nr:ATP phosphoribosyltransferase regulatory subunit [Clostridia bacterium]